MMEVIYCDWMMIICLIQVDDLGLILQQNWVKYLQEGQ